MFPKSIWAMRWVMCIDYFEKYFEPQKGRPESRTLQILQSIDMFDCNHILKRIEFNRPKYSEIHIRENILQSLSTLLEILSWIAWIQIQIHKSPLRHSYLVSIADYLCIVNVCSQNVHCAYIMKFRKIYPTHYIMYFWIISFN